MAKNKGKGQNPVFEGGTVSTVLGKETEFRGILTFKKSLQINGKFEGAIESEGYLLVAEGAEVKANLKALHVIIGGQVIGDVEAAEKVDLLETAQLTGNIKTKNLHVADGAVFEGNCERVTALAETTS